MTLFSAAHAAFPPVTLRCGVPASLPAAAYWRERFKLEGRALFHQSQTRRWLRLLNSHPVLLEVVQHCPRVLYKIYRPYLTRSLSMDQRLAVLAYHYGFMLRNGLGPLVAQAARAGVVLASVEGKSGSRYDIELRAAALFEREGELVLQLCEHGAAVYSVAFTFSDLTGRAAVTIGCTQGPNHGDGLAANRSATRELHGIRPKQLLVTLVRQLAYALGCGHVQLVGNANRVVLSALRQGKVCADYDQLWHEMGALERPDGDFQLRCEALAPPDLEAIVSKKRSEARKRHAVVETLAQQLATRLCMAAQPLRARA